MATQFTSLIASATLIEEELREHRRQLHKEAEQHRLEQLSQEGRPGWQCRTRRRVGQALITVGSWLSNDDSERTYMPDTNLSTL